MNFIKNYYYKLIFFIYFNNKLIFNNIFNNLYSINNIIIKKILLYTKESNRKVKVIRKIISIKS